MRPGRRRTTPIAPLRFAVRLTPRGGRDAVEGWGLDRDGRAYLKARVAAPAIDGAANLALEQMIARMLKRPRSAVRIVSGAQSRLKQVEVDGADAVELHRVFGAPGNLPSGG